MAFLDVCNREVQVSNPPPPLKMYPKKKTCHCSIEFCNLIHFKGLIGFTNKILRHLIPKKKKKSKIRNFVRTSYFLK